MESLERACRPFESPTLRADDSARTPLVPILRSPSKSAHAQPKKAPFKITFLPRVLVWEFSAPVADDVDKESAAHVESDTEDT